MEQLVSIELFGQAYTFKASGEVSEAQEVADTLVGAGIKVIMNYTSVPIKAPKKVKIQTTDPIEKLLHTLYYLSHTGYAEYK